MQIRRAIPDRRPTDLLCVGSLVFEQVYQVAVLDSVPNQDSSEILNTAVSIGGSATNVACRAAEIGAQASLLSGLGDGAHAAELTAGLATYGVSTKFLRVRPGVDCALVLILTDGAGGWSSYHRAAPELVLHPEDCPNSDEFGGIRIVHIDGYSFHSAGTQDFVERVLHRARAADCLVSVDAATPSMLGQRDFATWVMSQADIVFLNEQEARLACGVAEWAGAAEALLALGLETVVVKRGAQGAVTVMNGWRTAVPAVSTVVADTLGAGDAFVAATLCGLADGLPLEAAVRDGVAAGSRACAGHGSMGASLRWDALVDHPASRSEQCGAEAKGRAMR